MTGRRGVTVGTAARCHGYVDEDGANAGVG
jgi:hypothetical protein